MGYSYEFEGRFRVQPALTAAHREYLRRFADIRRVKRNRTLLRSIPDPLREAVGLPIGPDGCYFVGEERTAHGEVHQPSILDVNRPPADQPGLWCHWIPSDDGQYIEWDDGEKFYNFPQWLEYIIEHFLKPWEYVLAGEVAWQGDDEADRGVIIVRANAVDTLGAIVVYDDQGEARRLNVFLCHAVEDRKLVRKIGTRLRTDNVDIWVDEKKLLPGADWELEIGKALHSADAVIVCLSPTSVAKRGFIQREIRLAVQVADEQPEGGLFLFPVMLAPCEVPERLRRWQWLDVQQRGAYARLLVGLEACANSLSRAAGRSKPKTSRIM